MRARTFFAAVAGLFGPILASAAAVTMAPVSTFGTNGWLTPGSSAFLGTANNERGLAFGNDHLYLVSRSGGTFIRILDPTTGSDLGSLNTTGIAGGTFTVNTAAVGGDGAIYVNNLTTNSTTTAFTVYKWANEAAAPAVAYTGNGALAGVRVGDDLAVNGSGASTVLVAGYSNNPAVTGDNGYAVINPTAGTATAVAFGATPPNAGDFRLGLTLTDASHVLGTANGGSYRSTSFSGSTGTLLGTGSLTAVNAGATAERLMAYDLVGGVPLLAEQSTGDAHVSIYDVTDPNNPVFLATANNTTGTLTANANGTGELAWGPVVGNTATLYAMSTNSGIQAFTVTVAVPEPASIGLIALGASVLITRRRRPN